MNLSRAVAVCVSLAVCRCKTDGAPAADAPTPTAAEQAPLAVDAPRAVAPEVALANQRDPKQDQAVVAVDPVSEVGVDEAEPADEIDPANDVQPAHEGPYKVLILGDSLAATGFGALLERKLDERSDVVCYRKGKSASGLARPDFFDWMDQAKRQIEFRQPDLVVVIMGGNDGQDLTRSSGKGKRVHWGDDDWAAAYRDRMDRFLVEVSASQRKVLWLGLPTMGLSSLEAKLVTIREIQKEAVEALDSEARYVETAPFVTAEDGKLLKEARVGGKKPQKLRADDRIHFTMSGSEYLADQVLPEVLLSLGLVAPDSQEETGIVARP